MISDAQYYLEASYAPQENNFNFTKKEYFLLKILKREIIPDR